jgi:hypothetical protein
MFLEVKYLCALENICKNNSRETDLHALLTVLISTDKEASILKIKRHEIHFVTLTSVATEMQQDSS